MSPRLSSPALALLLLARAGHAQEAPPPPLPPGVQLHHPPAWVAVSATLEYAIEPGSQALCPDEAEFRSSEMAARLGYDPFDPGKKGVPVGRVRVVLGRYAQGFTSSYELFDTSGTRVSRNRFKAPGTDRLACRDAASSAGADLRWAFTSRSLKLADEAEARTAAAIAEPPKPARLPATPALPPPAEPPVSQARPPPPSAPASKEGGIHVGADAVFNPLVAPIGSAGGGLWVAFRLREPAVSIEADVRGLGSLGSADVSFPGRSLVVPCRWRFVTGVFAATVSRGPFFIGPLIEGGVSSASTDLSVAWVASGTPHAFGAGLRAGVAVAVAGGVSLRSLIEGEWLPVVPFVADSPINHFFRNGPFFSTTVGLGLAFHLWSPGERTF